MAGIERAGDEGGADVLATVAKRATDAVRRRALANEATVLGRLAHPGVVRLVAHTETHSHAQLLTERVPGSTLADLSLDSPAALAAIGAAAAAVVADLHALGIAHGSLAPAHLIVSGGRVVLCSFGRAGEATPAAMDRDVADLVVAFSTTAGRLDEPVTRVERRHLRRLDELLVGAASRSHSASDLGAAFAVLAGGADAGGIRSSVRPQIPLTDADGPDGVGPVPTNDDEPASTSPSRPDRPAPETPARLWRERVFGARRDRHDVTSTDPTHRQRRIMMGAAAGLTVVALWAALAPDPPDTALRAQLPTVAAPPATPTPSPAVAPTPPPPTAPPPTPAEAPDVMVVGNLVAVDDAWFEVGRSDDIVRIGDWDCDGTVSPAVLRPGTGEVFVFDGWVQGIETRRVEALTVVADATDIVATPAMACDTLVVVDGSGREAIIEVAP